MKLTGRLVCILAWLLMAIVQTIVVAGAPDRIVAFGNDITQATTAAIHSGAIFIAFGLTLALSSYVFKRWSPIVVIAASALYLLHWFPLYLVFKHGLIDPFRLKYLIGWNPGLRLSFLTRDVVLPVAFVIALVLAVLEVKRPRSAGQSRLN